MDLDASPLTPGLYQGGFPPAGPHLAQAGFTLLVLCAMEFQPPHEVPSYTPLAESYAVPDPFPGVQVAYAPNDDEHDLPPTPAQLKGAIKAARTVANTIREGGKVLVTCWAGRNRSGLVSALALHMLQGVSGKQAVLMVQRKRSRALTNPQFVRALYQLKEKG